MRWYRIKMIQNHPFSGQVSGRKFSRNLDTRHSSHRSVFQGHSSFIPPGALTLESLCSSPEPWKILNRPGIIPFVCFALLNSGDNDIFWAVLYNLYNKPYEMTRSYGWAICMLTDKFLQRLCIRLSSKTGKKAIKPLWNLCEPIC